MVAPAVVQRIDTMPLERVTVPALVFETRVTAGLLPLTMAPGTFARTTAAAPVRKMQTTSPRSIACKAVPKLRNGECGWQKSENCGVMLAGLAIPIIWDQKGG